MKKVILLGIIITLALSTSIWGWAAAVNEGIHLFWDIPFGLGGYSVATRIEKERGIEMESSKRAKNKMGFSQEYAKSKAGQRIEMLGYPVSIEYSATQYEDVRGYITESFTIKYETITQASDVLEQANSRFIDTVQGLVEKYGNPTALRVRLYSNHFSDEANVIEIKEMERSRILDFSFDFRKIGTEWEHYAGIVDVSINVLIGNIEFVSSYCDREESAYQQIRFANHVTQPEKPDIQFIEAKKKYEDSGF